MKETKKHKYMVCYTESDSEKNQTQVLKEYHDSFDNAVMRYTLLCGAKFCAVLADLENDKILYQYVLRGYIMNTTDNNLN